MTESPAEFQERSEKEYSLAMECQRVALKFLLEFERLILIEEDPYSPPNSIYIRVSKDVAKKLRDRRL